VNNVEARLSFEVEPGWRQAIAVDGGVVECGGGPIYVWVAVDAYTRRPIWFWRLAHQQGTTGNALRFPRRLRGRCLSVWATQSSPRVGVP